MQMTGEYRIAAPRDAVWMALNDIAILKRCLQGCERLERINDSTMAGTIAAKVGPVKATFKGEITLSEIDPPNGYRIAGEGRAGPTGHAKGGARVRLQEDGGNTVLAYTVDAALGGKLAQIGSRVVDAAAKKMADDFFRKFANEMGQAPLGAATPQPATAKEAVARWRHGGRVRGWWLVLGLVGLASLIALAFAL